MISFSKPLHILPLILLWGITVPAQIAPNDNSPDSSKAPVQRLLEENDFFRVINLELAAGQATTISDRGQDAIAVTLLGKKLVTRDGQSNMTSPLPEGEVRFVNRGNRMVVSNQGEGAAEVVVAFLKHHFDAEVRPCAEPRRCTRPIQTSVSQIGESTLLLTSGFITAYRHRLDKGGTLASSYYSSTGKDHLLLIAISDIEANFDGQEERLSGGQI